MDIETLNMRSASLERVLSQIKQQLEDKDYSPVAIIGKSGIGKTESIAGLAKEMGIGFKEIRLSHYQESDLVGLPYVENGVTRHAPSSILPPSDDTKQGILLLDEITSSDKNMRSAVYQLMDSRRRLGEYLLPENWLIVACGNGPDDGGDFRGIEPAFTNRGFGWRVEPDITVWKHWALRSDIHPTVIAYLTFMPEKLHVMNIDNPYDMIASPRSWSKLSTQLKNMEKRTKKGIIESDDDLEFAAAGCVGSNCGPGFSAFYRYNKKVIDPQDILDGKVKPSDMANVDEEVLYITAQNLVHLVVKDINAHKADTEATVDDACLKRMANLMNWVTSLPKAGVRLDVVVTLISDLESSLGKRFTVICMSDVFDEVCPQFIDFLMKNKIVYNVD